MADRSSSSSTKRRRPQQQQQQGRRPATRATQQPQQRQQTGRDRTLPNPDKVREPERSVGHTVDPDEGVEVRGYGVGDGEELEADLKGDSEEEQDDEDFDSDEEDEDRDENDDALYGDEDDDEAYAEPEPVEEYTAESYRSGVFVPMPSGKGLRLRPYSLVTMVRTGQLPNHLQAAADRMLYTGSVNPPAGNRAEARKAGSKSVNRPSGAAAAAERRRQEIDDNAELIDYLVCELVASFKVVADRKPRNGEIHVSQIFDSDKQAIVTFAMEGQKALAAFR